ncbi:MAG: hypothetical protein ACR2JO_09100 [Mycobacteriales bacterium]
MSGNDTYEDRLRQLLLAEAATVTPAGGGLSQIRAKVARRRARLRWLRPGLAVVTAAALAGAAVFAVTLGEPARQTLKTDQHVATQPPAPSASTGPTSASPTPVSSGGPLPVGQAAYTIWPFTSLAQAQAWQRAGGSQPWHLDPRQTALFFVNAYLQAPEVNVVMASTAETTSVGVGRKVTLGRTMADGKLREVTVVHLVRLGSGSTAPYAVTRSAGTYTLKISSPGIAAPVRSPLQVRGTIDGVHQSVRVELRMLARPAPISAPASGPGSATTGWQTTVSFTAPASGVGTLVARTDSDAGDGATQITAQPVLLTAGTKTSATHPSTFLGTSTDGRIAVFDATSGGVVRYLTDPQPGGGVSDLTLSPDGSRVYFTRGTGTCAAQIASVPVAGGPETVAVTAPVGSLVSNPVLIGEGGTVAYVRTFCADAGQAVVVSSLGGGGGSQTWYAALHYGVKLFGWQPGSPHLLLRESAAGGSSQLRLLDVTKPQGPLEPAAPVVRQPVTGCSYSAASWSPAGRIVVGQSCSDGSAQVLLLPASPAVGTPQQLAVLPRWQSVSTVDYDLAGSAVVLGVSRPGSTGGYVARLVGGQLTTVVVGPVDPHWN